MDKDLLEKHQNDSAWAEVIRLYSGLFDTQDEREEFILDLADKDILLAAECKTSSVGEEIELTQSIVDKTYKLNDDVNHSSIYSLLELQRYDMAFDILRIKSNLSNNSLFFNKILDYIKEATLFYQLMDVCIENKKIKKYFITFLSFGRMEKSLNVNRNEVSLFMNFLNNLIEHNINPAFAFFSFNVPLTKQTLPILINTITYLKIIGISDKSEKLINKYSIKSSDFDCLINTDKDFIDLFLNEVRNQYLEINIEKIISQIRISLKKNLFFNFKKIVQKKLQINDREFIGLMNRIKLKAIVKRHTEYGIQVKLIKFRKAFGLLKSHLVTGTYDNKRMYPGQLIDVRIIDFHTKQKATFIFSMKEFDEKNRVHIIQNSYNKANFIKLATLIKNRFIIDKEYSFDFLYSELEKYTGRTFKGRAWERIFQNILIYLSYFKAVTISNDTVMFNQVVDGTFLYNSTNVVNQNILICEIDKIIPSRVFVKIENEPRSTSIYIGELSNKRIENIFDFEYNGEKLHVGQKLIAKVISIGENKINLSLKQIKNG